MNQIIALIKCQGKATVITEGDMNLVLISNLESTSELKLQSEKNADNLRRACRESRMIDV